MNQMWKHLDAKEIQQFVLAADLWKDALEERSRKNLLDGSCKSDWIRARKPRETMKRVTWLKHVDKIVRHCGEIWTSTKKDGDGDFVPTLASFIKGPPISIKLEADAELLNLPSPTAISTKHLYGYITDLRAKIEQAQLTQHITNERAFRYAVATTLETLQIWESAAEELQHVADIEESLKEYVYMGRVLLRKGIALYNAKLFSEAVDIFNHAIRIINNKVPQGAALRTEVRLWDYLGLCFVKLNDPAKALKIFFDKNHIIRAKKVSTPLGDASRVVRVGIAYLDLGDFVKAKAAFIEGVALRLTVGAYAEAVVALRYLGLLYFRMEYYVQALTIWNLCLKVQRGIQNQNENIKLEFFRARLFAKLWEITESDSQAISFPIACKITSVTFPDKQERDSLIFIANRFRDVTKTYRRVQLLKIAHAEYNHCLNLANDRGDAKWANEARAQLAALPPSQQL